MREIKFRVRNDSGENVDGGICFNYDDYDWVVLNDEYEQILSNYSGILEQYTGLKDKNGVEIYEGDIVECLDSCGFEGVAASLSGEVAFNGGCFCVKGSDGYHNRMALICAEDVEVIGNIHQNPELLDK